MHTQILYYMRRIYLFIVAVVIVLTVDAQEIDRTRNCRPGLADIDLSEHNFRHAPAILGQDATKAERWSQGESPYIGDRRQLVVMAAFKDQAFKGDEFQTMELWNKIFNARNYTEEPFNGSVHDYFYDQSYGQFRLTFDLYYVVVDDKIKYRSTNTEDENSKYLVQDIMEIIRNKVDDWAIYDWDDDGYVDQLLIIYSGKGQNAGGGSNTIWPHQWWLSQHKDCEPVIVDSGGKSYLVDSYCCVQELYSNDSYGIFGTICHEFSHCLGLPDFYNGSTEYLASWDLMDYGNYNGKGFRPCGYSAFERSFMGWMNPVELNTDTTVTGIPELSDQPKAYLIRNDGKPEEYYIVENRQQTGWDADLPGRGIIVAHVDYDEYVFLKGVPNTSKRQRYSIFPANNTQTASDKNVKGWAYPYNSNNELTNTSEPAATLNNANVDGTLLMSKPIIGMTVSDGLASFSFRNLYTGISHISKDNKDVESNIWFTIDGRRITGRPLTPGLYIHEGKLSLIR